MSNSKPGIIYCCFGLSTFVRKDIDILSSAYQVAIFDFFPRKKWMVIPILFKQLFFFFFLIFTARLIVIQFSGYHSILPCLLGRLTGKPTLVVVGGTDAHCFTILRYGNFYKPVLRMATSLTYRLCSCILPKHESLWFSEYQYSMEGQPHQGIMAFMPNLKKPHVIIPNGYNAEPYRMSGEKRKRRFLTIAGGLHYSFQKQLKGIDLITSIAPNFPDCEFIIVGGEGHIPTEMLPPNIRLKPLLSVNDVITEMQRAEFYLQLSMAEGFPNALCEAMLCECVPIGSDVFSISEIIGEAGFILKHKNIEELKILIQKALNCDSRNLGKTARNSIVRRFSLEKRGASLLRIVSDYL